MSGLQNFLAPFSHLLFLNRNIDIIVLCFVIFVVTIIALQNGWRTTRLERELSSARSSLSTSPAGRRYAATPTAAEAPPQETGGALPPVKGGRTYARNLGSALQKAGMSQPIYSPPTPAGWSPQQNPGQPGVGQQGIPQAPFAAPNVPWASTPPTPAPIPWAFPGGAGRNVQGPPPSPAPFFPPPQPTPAQMSPGMSQPPSGPAPSVYSPPPPGAGGFPPPPPMTGPFTAPQFTPPASGPMPAPAFPPVMNPMAQPAPPAAPDDGSDAARRGKPKRRRFNFNVLENLEKMVQPKPSEPIPSTNWTPPAQPAAPPAAPAQTPAQATFSAIPQAPSGSSPATPSVAPPATPTSEPAEKKAGATPLPSFLFGKHGPPDPEPTKAPEPAVTEPVLDFAAPAAAEAAAVHTDETAAVHADETAAVEPETSTTPAPAEEETVAAPEAKPDTQRSMRSMMFGEEASAPAPSPARPEEPAVDAEPVSEAPAAAEPKAEDTGEAWPSYPWNRREEASSSGESEATEPASPANEETAAESGHDIEPAADVTPAEQHDPWRADVVEEPEAWRSSTDTDTHAEAPPADEAHSAVAEVGADAGTESSEPPVASGGEKSGSGTIVIIEDDQAAASYYATLFRGNGYQVEVANDGVSGVDLCTRVQPQVILLDVMMPRQNGILVLQTLRASDETKSTPVVVMSNFSEPTLIKRAIQLGALEYVIKTQVEGPALLNAVPRWMNREKAFAAA